MGEDSSSDDRENVTDGDLLDVLQQAGSPILSTSEIADLDEVSVTQGQVLKRLKSLEEEGHVSSEVYSAKPQVRLWWHEGVDMKRAQPSNDELTDKIGVEVVDVLEDLPGRNEILRKRREAINSVFKFLFNNESGSKEKMHLVGWGVAMDTYDDNRDSLWNNCLKPALEQSPFFTLNKSEKVWYLSELGLEIKQMDSRALWDDWDEHKKELDLRYHSVVWESVYDKDATFHIDYQEHSSSVAEMDEEIGHVIGLALVMDGPVWSCSTGSFKTVLDLYDDPENLEVILENRNSLTSDLEQDARWGNYIEDESALQLTCSYPVEIEVPTMLQQQGKNCSDMNKQLKQMTEWGYETKEQLFTIAQDANRLVE